MKLLRRYLGLLEKDPEAERIIDADNMRFGRLMAVIVMAFEAYMIVAYGMFGNKNSYWHSYRLIAYWVFFVASLIMFIFSMSVLKGKIKGHRIINIVGIGYCIIAMTWSMMISAIDYSNGKQAFVFITIMLCVSGFAYFKPVISIPILSVVFGSFYIVLSLIDGGHSAIFVNYAVMWFMVVTLNAARYHMKLSDVKSRLELAGFNSKLREMSLYDNLTKLKNRHCLSIDKENFIGKSLFMMIVDLDDFKSVNDTYGHDEGDNALIKFSEVLRKNFFVQNVYRLGGEEFLIAVSDCEKQIMLEKTKRCIDEMPSLIVGNGERRISFSGGCLYCKCYDDNDYKDLFRQIDDALYDAKRSGKNRVVQVKDR